MAEDQSQERGTLQGRFFTAARRFQQRIGAWPDGTKIPGGPYTHTQVGVMVGVLIAGWATMPLWGADSPVRDFLILISVAYGTAFLIGKAPMPRRNIFGLAGSCVALLMHPGAGGRYKGRPLRLSRKAQKIQRECKHAAKTRRRNHPDSAPEATQANLSPQGPIPTGYGSSLHRLLAEHGLLKTEGKH